MAIPPTISQNLPSSGASSRPVAELVEHTSVSSEAENSTTHRSHSGLAVEPLCS